MLSIYVNGHTDLILRSFDDFKSYKYLNLMSILLDMIRQKLHISKHFEDITERLFYF